MIQPHRPRIKYSSRTRYIFGLHVYTTDFVGSLQTIFYLTCAMSVFDVTYCKTCFMQDYFVNKSLIFVLEFFIKS